MLAILLPGWVWADYTWENVPAGYGLTWSDEFNGTVGSAPNSANWTYDTGAGGWGNNELENYTTSTANSQIVADPNAVDGKSLAIIALDPGGNNDVAGDYTSARLVSSLGTASPNVTFQYGYMEARVKLPYGDGIWPAFWMLGTDINTGTTWPTCGEIDIAENIGNAGTYNGNAPDQSNNHGSLHDGTDFTSIFTIPGGQLFHNAYHTFGARWQANQIQFYVDGNLYETVNSSQQPGTWEFNNQFFFLLNLAVGGNWPGNPDVGTSFPQTMYVDYVRAYQSGQPTPTPVMQSTWRIHSGGDNYTDSSGNLWVADTNFAGGWPTESGTAITGNVLPAISAQTLYQYQRYGNTTGGETVTYTFNVPTGSNYDVTLKFAETYWTAANKRQFNYSINGTTEKTNFDIYAQVGANTALDEVYNNITPDTNGQIVIQFTQGAYDNPSVGAIQIIPIIPTATSTNTSTNTATTTSTNTATQTATATPTLTPVITSTFTETSTYTPTNTPTNTPTHTATNTVTNTITGTSPPTDTATNTSTNTASSTATNTPTNTASPTATHSATNTSSSTATNSPTNTVTQTATNTPASTLVITNTFTNTTTNTASSAATNTPTATPTNTATTTATNTFTPPSTSTSTSTPTVTSTYTPTLSSVIVISPPFPNPSTRSPISFNVQVPGSSTVSLDVFTLAFRKIYSQTEPINGSQTLQWDLRDVSGTPVSNGLYYVRIHVNGGQSATKIIKVLILR